MNGGSAPNRASGIDGAQEPFAPVRPDRLRPTPSMRTVEPDPALRELYDARYRLYRETYPALAPAMHELATSPSTGESHHG